MKRGAMIEKLKFSTKQWDVIVIGGGATGLGAALDAVSRGYSTILVEQADFAQATSSRSTKLVHGGVRYLRQGKIGFVREALQERSLLLQNAPHLVHPLPFLLPTKSWFAKYYYFTGIKLYDLLAGSLSFGASTALSRSEMLQRLPTIESSFVTGGVCYYDGQFDDARLAINLAQTINEHGGVPLNYMQVCKLIQVNNKVTGVFVRDIQTNHEYEIQGKVIVNATGVFVDSIRKMDASDVEASIIPSQGSHIVIDRSFFPGDAAMIIPETDDGRVLFTIPWHHRVLVGTTDIASTKISMEPKPQEAEIEYLLEYTGKYLTKRPKHSDILSTFAGLRPLVKPKGSFKATSTSSLSRDHTIMVSSTQLISVTGGKWTTYRKLGEDTISTAARIANLPDRPSGTKHMPIHGWCEPSKSPSEWNFYGSDLASIKQLAADNPSLSTRLHPDLPCRGVDVIWSVRHEMACNVEDILSRRTRCLLLGAAASIEIAPKVAALMAKELGKDKEWEQNQVKAYDQLAQGYFRK